MRHAVVAFCLLAGVVLAGQAIGSGAVDETRQGFVPGTHVPPRFLGAVEGIRIEPVEQPRRDPPYFWDKDILIDTGTVADYDGDYNEVDGKLWVANIRYPDSVCRIFRSTDHGMRWEHVSDVSTTPLSRFLQVRVLVGQGDTSYVYVFLRNILEHGNILVARLKPDASGGDAFWVTAGPDTVNHFTVARDLRPNYNLYMIYDNQYANGANGHFARSTDYGKSWATDRWGNAWDNDLCAGSSGGVVATWVYADTGRRTITAEANYNYGDTASWGPLLWPTDDQNYHYYPKIALEPVAPDSQATAYIVFMYDRTQKEHLEVRYSVRSHQWGDTWRRDQPLATGGAYVHTYPDIRAMKRVNYPYLCLTYNRFDTLALDTAKAVWRYVNTSSPTVWSDPLNINDTVRQATYWPGTRVLYTPGAPHTGAAIYGRYGGEGARAVYFNSADNPGGISGAERERGMRSGRVLPNPARGLVQFVSGTGEAAPGVAVYDASGQLVRDLGRPRAGAPLVWDGLDRNGRVVVAGIYLVRLEGSTRSSGKFVYLGK